MAVQVKMPQLSDTMNSGKIVQWQKKEGEQIKRGDILAEVETDKANLEIEAFDEGTLLKITVPANGEAKVGEVIAFIGAAGESISAGEPASAKPAKKESAKAKEPAAPEADKRSLSVVSRSPAANVDRPPTAQQGPTYSSHNGAENNGPSGDEEQVDRRVKASPLARKIASQRGVDLAGLRGSGPEGRIVRQDVELAASTAGRFSEGSADDAARRAIAQDGGDVSEGQVPSSEYAPDEKAVVFRAARGNEAREARAGQEAPANPGINKTQQNGQVRELSKMRQTIARRMEEAMRSTPHFYMTTSIDVRQAFAFRESIRDDAEFKSITINHLIIKAAAYALARERRVNSSYRDGALFEPDQINIGIVTALEDGLLIPVVRDADKLSLKDLAFETKAAVERAKAGRPSSSDLTGGTFSISNMGMFDVEEFTAIINPGQGAILAISAVKDVAVVENNQIVPGKIMKVTLSVDHRIIDGVVAARFLQHFTRGLSNPALLLLQ